LRIRWRRGMLENANTSRRGNRRRKRSVVRTRKKRICKKNRQSKRKKVRIITNDQRAE
jgi:hypothetical protein